MRLLRLLLRLGDGRHGGEPGPALRQFQGCNFFQDAQHVQIGEARIVLAGEPPKPTAPPPGCPFASRCFHPRKDARCTTELPPLRPINGSVVACHHADEWPDGSTDSSLTMLR